MASVAILFPLLVVFGFILFMFTQVGMSNCYNPTTISKLDLTGYIGTMIDVLVNPCPDSPIPAWLNFIILIPMAVAIAAIGIELLPLT